MSVPFEMADPGVAARVDGLERERRERDHFEAHVDRISRELARAHEDLVLARGREDKLAERLAAADRLLESGKARYAALRRVADLRDAEAAALHALCARLREGLGVLFRAAMAASHECSLRTLILGNDIAREAEFGKPPPVAEPVEPVPGEGEADLDAADDRVAEWLRAPGGGIDQALARAAAVDHVLPRCHTCGKPATCYGSYEGNAPDYGRDDCCGHGCEDGHCEPVAPVEETEELPPLVRASPPPATEPEGAEDEEGAVLYEWEESGDRYRIRGDARGSVDVEELEAGKWVAAEYVASPLARQLVAEAASAEKWRRAATDLQERVDRSGERAERAEGDIASYADLLNVGLRETGAGPEVGVDDLRPGIRALWWGLNRAKGSLASVRHEALNEFRERAEVAEAEVDRLRARLARAERERDAQWQPRGWACARCGAALDLDSRWHHLDGCWEHKCGDLPGQAGHIGIAVPRVIFDQLGEQRGQLAEADAALRAAGRDAAKICEAFDTGLFIRNVSRDGETGWALILAPYLAALARLGALGAEPQGEEGRG